MKIIKATELLPVSFTYAGNDDIQFSATTETVTHKDGYTLYNNTMINSLLDVSTNGYSFIGLIGPKNTTDLVTDKTFDVSLLGPLLMRPYSSTNPRLKFFIINKFYEFEVTNTTTDGIGFIFDYIEGSGNSKYYKIRYRNKVFSLDNADKLYIDDDLNLDTQIFRLLEDSGNRYFLYSKNNKQAHSPVGGTIDSFKFFTTDLKGIDYDNDISTILDGYQSPNKWISYDNFYSPEYSNATAIMSVNEAKSIEDITTSYLLYTALSTVAIHENNAVMNLDFIPTKDFKTIDSDLGLIPLDSGNLRPEDVKFRNYNRIYTGGNQIEGYSNIHLGYDSKYSSIIEIKPDTYTYFHMPKYAIDVDINASGLDRSGAFGGLTPQFADRIYEKLADYTDSTWWGGGTNNGKQSGTWLCAWLSGGDTSSVWLERYYDPGKMTPDVAMNMSMVPLSRETSVFVKNGTPVYDVVSTMKVQAGAYYKYYHMGVKGYESMTSAFNGASEDSIRLLLQDFNNTEIIRDSSVNSNDATVIHPEAVDLVSMDFTYGNVKNNAILLNGVGELQINGTPSINILGDKSINLWTYTKNFYTDTSSTIFSYYLRGGDKLEYINHGLYYSYIIPSTDGDDTDIRISPSDLEDNTLILDVDSIGGKAVSVSVDLDGYHWIAVYDETNLLSKILKLTQSGQVLESVTLDGIEVYQILIKNDDHGMIVYSRDGIIYTRIFVLSSLNFAPADQPPAGNGIPYYYMNYNSITGSSDPKFERNVIELDVLVLKSSLLGCIYYKSNGDRTLEIRGSVKEFSFLTTYDSICGDGVKYGYITGRNTINNTAVLIKVDASDISDIQTLTISESTSNVLNKVFIVKEHLNGVSTDIIYWVCGTRINRYYLNARSELEFINEICLTYSLEGDINGDYSGYKLNKLTHAINKDIPYLKYTTFMNINNNDTRVTLKTVPNDFSNNWNMVTIINNTSTKMLTMYINSEYATRVPNLSGESIYSNGSIFTIGSASEGPLSVSSALKLRDRNLDGGITDFALFSRALESSDITTLYRSKVAGSDNISWVIDNGRKFFVEDLQYMFKFKKPGIKSQFFNININNLDIPIGQQDRYNGIIKDTIAESLPVNSKLVDINWR